MLRAPNCTETVVSPLMAEFICIVVFVGVVAPGLPPPLCIPAKYAHKMKVSPARTTEKIE